MIVLRIERGVIRIGFLHDLSDADDARGLDAAVVEEDLVADFHRAHKISRLVVAHPVPAGGLLQRFRQIVDRERFRLRFHQPVFHRLYSILLRKINHEETKNTKKEQKNRCESVSSWLILLFLPRHEQHLEKITPRTASGDDRNAGNTNASIRPRTYLRSAVADETSFLSPARRNFRSASRVVAGHARNHQAVKRSRTSFLSARFLKLFIPGLLNR